MPTAKVMKRPAIELKPALPPPAGKYKGNAKSLARAAGVFAKHIQAALKRNAAGGTGGPVDLEGFKKLQELAAEVPKGIESLAEGLKKAVKEYEQGNATKSAATLKRALTSVQTKFASLYNEAYQQKIAVDRMLARLSEGHLPNLLPIEKVVDIDTTVLRHLQALAEQYGDQMEIVLAKGHPAKLVLSFDPGPFIVQGEPPHSGLQMGPMEVIYTSSHLPGTAIRVVPHPLKKDGKLPRNPRTTCPHPHIMSDDGDFCMGGAATIVGAAIPEGRLSDAIAAVMAVILEPKDGGGDYSLRHWEGHISLCTGCGEQVTDANRVKPGAKGCKNCFGVCSGTGGVYPKEELVELGGKLLHAAHVVYLDAAAKTEPVHPKDCPVLPFVGIRIHPKRAAECCVSGLVGQPLEILPGRDRALSTNIYDMLRLPDGRAVLMACLDLIERPNPNPDQNPVKETENGTEAKAAAAPWWADLVEVTWHKQSPHFGRLYGPAPAAPRRPQSFGTGPIIGAVDTSTSGAF